MGATKTGRVGRNSGYNAYALRTTKNLHCALGAKLTDTGEKHALSVTQDHGAMEGRPIIREANLDGISQQGSIRREFREGFRHWRSRRSDSCRFIPIRSMRPKKTGASSMGHVD